MFQETRRGAVTVVSTDQPLTVDNVEQAAEILERCSRVGSPAAVLDLERVPLLDSAAMELLLNAHERFEQRGGAFKVAGGSRLCREALEVTGVGQQLNLFDDVTSAIRSYLQ